MTHWYLPVAYWLACLGLGEAIYLRWHIRDRVFLAGYLLRQGKRDAAYIAVESAERFADLRRQLVFLFIVALVFLIAPH